MALKSCPKHAVLILTNYDGSLAKLRDKYRNTTEPNVCGHDKVFFADNASLATLPFVFYHDLQKRQTLGFHPVVDREACNKEHVYNAFYNNDHSGFSFV